MTVVMLAVAAGVTEDCFTAATSSRLLTWSERVTVKRSAASVSFELFLKRLAFGFGAFAQSVSLADLVRRLLAPPCSKRPSQLVVRAFLLVHSHREKASVSTPGRATRLDDSCRMRLWS
jgi:hypothetical protein